MEPRLNVRISNLFLEPLDGPNPVDVDFIPQGVQMDNDFMDADSNDAARNMATEQDSRGAWSQEIDRDNASGQQHGQEDAFGDGTGAQFPYQRAAMQSQGFNNRQAHRNATLGVVANLVNNTLVGGRVYAKTARTNVQGTIIAVGDREFSVIWDDRTASVERKSDYELVIKN